MSGNRTVRWRKFVSRKLTEADHVWGNALALRPPHEYSVASCRGFPFLELRLGSTYVHRCACPSRTVRCR